MTDDFFADAFGPTRALVILRGFDVETTLELAHRAVARGVRMIEVPVQTRDAVEALAATVRALEGSAIVGAGTVTTLARLEAAQSAGARFTVAPGIDAEVASASAARGLPHLPGVATATEVHIALSRGFRWLKAFPAAALGTDWLSAMAGPFPEARFVATGGIDAGNAASFLSAGARAVAFGSSFARLDPGVFAELTGPSGVDEESHAAQ